MRDFGYLWRVKQNEKVHDLPARLERLDRTLGDNQQWLDQHSTDRAVVADPHVLGPPRPYNVEVLEVGLPEGNQEGAKPGEIGARYAHTQYGLTYNPEATIGSAGACEDDGVPTKLYAHPVIGRPPVLRPHPSQEVSETFVELGGPRSWINDAVPIKENSSVD